MATGARFVLPFQTVIDASGVPLPGAQLFFYESGTSTPLDTYSDVNLTVPNTNPVVANAGGMFGNIFMQAANYKVVLEDAFGALIWTADPVSGSGSGGFPSGASNYLATIAALRAFVPSVGLVGTQIQVGGYYAVGDGGGGWFDVLNMSPGGDNGGTFINSNTVGYYYSRAVTQPMDLRFFGLKGDNATDGATQLAALITYMTTIGGGEVFIPPGNFVYGSDQRVLGNYISWIGTGPKSALVPKNSAKFYLGNALSSGGTNILLPIFEKMAFNAQANHDGAILIADNTQNFMCRDCSVSVASNDGSTSTDGIMLRWTQYTMIENLLSFVNRYNIFISLELSPLQNEDHYSIAWCWLYSAKTPKAGDTPANIAIQRVTGRTSNIEQFAVYSTHFGKFLDGGASATTSGILGINEGGAGDKRELENGNLESCWFENHDYGVNFGTNTTNDTSFVSARTCQFLLIGSWAFFGSSQFKTGFEIDSCFLLNSAGAKSGARACWSGRTVMQTVGTIQGDSWVFDAVTNKCSQGSIVSTSGGVVLKGQNILAATASASSDVIAHGLGDNGTGIVPTNFKVVPSWDTTIFVNGVGATNFTVNYGTPPGGGNHVYWEAELIQQ